ncbi:MAG: malate synthase [Bacteriovoracaceae bacterium]
MSVLILPKMSNESLELFPVELQNLLLKLHTDFNPRRLDLLKEREIRQSKYDSGSVPEFLDKSSIAVTTAWKVHPIPQDLLCRRVEITGPVNSAKMVINMLSRNESGARADMAMLDFEDSMMPSWTNILDGFKNVIGAVSGNLSYVQPATSTKPEKTYRLDANDMAAVMVRVRGLHLNEENVQIQNTPISGGLFDLVTCFYHTAKIYLAQKKTPKFYVPKCEHYLEARWWNDLFTALEKSMNLPVPTLRATFLIETLPATYQVEEILYELKEHAVGLNVGRWDKIFSDIKVLKNHSDKVLADRASITMACSWMENYAKRVVKICHSHGAFGMGGMSAFTPGKTENERNAQTERVIADKKREWDWGHDGCWVSHPYFIGIAVEAFKKENQLNILLNDFDKYSSILPQAEGPKTINGLCTNLRVGIAYMQGWNAEIGCVSWDGLMEDLATLEISRAQVWQWLHHKVKLDDGTIVTEELVKKNFESELQKILKEVHISEHESFIKAHDQASKIFTLKNLPNFLGDALKQI